MSPLNPKYNGEFHENGIIYLRLGIGKNTMQFYGDDQGKNGSNRNKVCHWTIGIPMIQHPLLHYPIVKKEGIFFDHSSTWITITFE